MFSILTRFDEVVVFIDDVVKAADQNKNALGFFAASVFREFARVNQLYVVVEHNGGRASYAGHLLFSCRFPKASVLQVFVSSDHRGQGAAAILLDRLKLNLTELGYLTIYARVAEDLVGANSFWEREQFYVLRIEQGGAARKRIILVRAHELDSPQLFSPSGVSSSNPLGLNTTPVTEAPLYLLDLNVLFDLGPRRIRHDDALDLFRAERIGLCRFAVSTELANELQRTATERKTDPMQAYMRIFPAFPFLKNDTWEDPVSELADMVFQHKQRDQLSANDKSDLRHLATAIQHKLAGLITNDTAILNVAAKLKELYGIQVLSPTAFKQSASVVAGDDYETPSEDILTLSAIIDADEKDVYSLLKKLQISGSAIASEWTVSDKWNRVSSRYGVRAHGDLLGYLTWPAWNPGEMTIACVAIDESSPLSFNAAQVLLLCLLQHAVASGNIQVQIRFPSHQTCLREVASGLGFCGTSADGRLNKIVLEQIVTNASWAQCRDTLFSIGGLKLPDSIPVYRSIDQRIRLLRSDGNASFVTLGDLETLLSPALFCLPGRGAVITPVQREFSEQLLGHSPQWSLFPQSKAMLFRQRHYLSSPRTLNQFKRGELILFYESRKRKGLGGIVAIARIRQAYLKLQDELKRTDLDPSVLDDTSIHIIGKSKEKTVTVFDNVIHFSKLIGLDSLRRLGCGKSTDLLTTRTITGEQLEAIISEGTGCG